MSGRAALAVAMTSGKMDSFMSMQTPEEQGGRKSEPVFNMPGIIIALVAICSIIYVWQEYFANDQQYSQFMLNFALIPARFSLGEGFTEPAALFTFLSYSFLHGGLAHIVINMIWLAAFGSPLAGRIGTARLMLFWLFTAVIAGLTHYAIYPDSIAPLVGASGAISGMMGAAARYGFRRTNAANRPEFAGPLLPIALTVRLKPVITFVGIWFVLNIVTGLYAGAGSDYSSIAWEAHIGGFIAGFFGIALLDRPRSYDAVLRKY